MLLQSILEYFRTCSSVKNKESIKAYLQVLIYPKLYVGTNSHSALYFTDLGITSACRYRRDFGPWRAQNLFLLPKTWNSRPDIPPLTNQLNPNTTYADSPKIVNLFGSPPKDVISHSPIVKPIFDHVIRD